jgi:hypothetical protein
MATDAHTLGAAGKARSRVGIALFAYDVADKAMVRAPPIDPQRQIAPMKFAVGGGYGLAWGMGDLQKTSDAKAVADGEIYLDEAWLLDLGD